MLRNIFITFSNCLPTEIQRKIFIPNTSLYNTLNFIVISWHVCAQFSNKSVPLHFSFVKESPPRIRWFIYLLNLQICLICHSHRLSYNVIFLFASFIWKHRIKYRDLKYCQALPFFLFFHPRCSHYWKQPANWNLTHVHPRCVFSVFSESRATSKKFQVQFARQLGEEDVTRLRYVYYLYIAVVLVLRSSRGIPAATRDIQFPPRPLVNEISLFDPSIADPWEAVFVISKRRELDKIERFYFSVQFLSSFRFDDFLIWSSDASEKE